MRVNLRESVAHRKGPPALDGAFWAGPSRRRKTARPLFIRDVGHRKGACWTVADIVGAGYYSMCRAGDSQTCELAL